MLRWGRLARAAAETQWDDEGWCLTARQVQLAREAGALDQLPILLLTLAVGAVWRGDFVAATSLIAEADAVGEATWARVLVSAGNGQLSVLSRWALPELVEAAVRTGNGGEAGDALGRLANRPGRAAVTGGWPPRPGAGRCWPTRQPPSPPSRRRSAGWAGPACDPRLPTQLLYGEWLRRQRRPADARGQLRTSVQMLEAMGMEAFAERGRRELRAAGGTTRKRAVTTTAGLAAQDAQIARLAADSLSNPEIGTRLFLSARTVQFHLRKVFTKLDIISRAQLNRDLPGS
jgi:DNA-binding CsgD family transcriptional regulator